MATVVARPAIPILATDLRPLVLGLTGANASGKGEVASWLAGRGFLVHSLSDAVREEARARGLSTSREDLIRVGNDLRRLGGPGILAQRMLPSLGTRDVVDSIRNPAEVEVLRTLPRFVLLGIWAPESLRFARALARARPGDPTTLEEFRRREEQENASDAASQQLTATFGLADRVVTNAGDRETLWRTLAELLDALTGDAALR
jgi:dephospho-CoA kinase